MNLKDLEKYFAKIKSASDKFESIKGELSKIQQEISDYFSGAEEWQDKDVKQPALGQKILIGEKQGNKEVYNVIIYTDPAQLIYKYWVKIDLLPE